MKEKFNIGIDLGSSDSSIGRFINSDVTIMDNPEKKGSLRIPSVVCSYRDITIVGNEAKKMLEKDDEISDKCVVTKRNLLRMWEPKHIYNIVESRKSYITFSMQDIIHYLMSLFKINSTDYKKLDSVVIAISDTFVNYHYNQIIMAVQNIGISNVFLIQDSIAASLAYFKLKNIESNKNFQWLVYDFGGCKFNASLVKLDNNELSLIDKEGNDFLGGMNIDQLIVDKLILPKINKTYSFESYLRKLKKEYKWKYSPIKYILLNNAEDAKKRLTTQDSVVVKIRGFKDARDIDVNIEITISRFELNELIEPIVNQTIEMSKELFRRNSNSALNTKFILMVGGSTYIPYVRQKLQEKLQIPLNCEIDPTTAITVGATYYASTMKVSDNILKYMQRPINLPTSVPIV